MRRGVRVGIQRKSDPRMAQDFLQDLRVLSGFEPEGCERLLEIIGLDARQTSLL